MTGKSIKRAFALVLTLAMILTCGNSSLLSKQTASAAAKVTLKATKASVSVKEKKKVTLKITKKNVKTIKSQTWKSKNTKVATVTKKGVVTGVKAGTTKVTCKVVYVAKGKKKAQTKTLTYTVKVTSSVVTEQTNVGKERTLSNGSTTKDNGLMRADLSSADMMKFMGLGWNYGNSLEQSIDTASMSEAAAAEVTVNYCETSANNLALTQENVDTLKKYGFKNIRIPVAWSNMCTISEDKMTYTINKDYLKRVEEVLNYALNDEMYVIINIHYDGDWWGMFGDADQNVRKQAWARYEQFWTQIAEYYKDYSDRLIFESANEELGDRLNDDWVNKSTENKTGVLTVAEQYETLNAINQKFVDIVRSSGGNNADRYLLIAGYSTNIAATCNEQFVMPTDKDANGKNLTRKNRLSVSVHYYSPWNYCGGTEYHQGEGDAARLLDWGTDEQIASMKADLEQMKKFTDQGYGVIIGEFGVQTTAVDGITTYIKTLSQYGLENSMCPVFWDNGGWFDREKNVMRYDDISDVIKEITGSDYSYTKQNVTTGKPLYSLATDESALTCKYTWEGQWKKNGGGNNTYLKDALGNDLISLTTDGPVLAYDGANDIKSADGLYTLHVNNYGYWAVVHSEEFANYTQPYIRVTCMADTTNEYEDFTTPAAIIDSSALQVSYADFKESAPGDLEKCTNGKAIEIASEEEWSGKIYAIDKSFLEGHSMLWFSASNKPIITKIEIFDGPAVE